jgi:hypothetical protein
MQRNEYSKTFPVFCGVFLFSKMFWRCDDEIRNKKYQWVNMNTVLEITDHFEQLVIGRNIILKLILKSRFIACGLNLSGTGQGFFLHGV